MYFFPLQLQQGAGAEGTTGTETSASSSDLGLGKTSKMALRSTDGGTHD